MISLTTNFIPFFMKPPRDSKEDENAIQNMGGLKMFDRLLLIFKDDPIEA